MCELALLSPLNLSPILQSMGRVKNFPSDNSKLAEMEFYLMSDRSGERSRARRGLRGRRSQRRLVGPRHGCGALVILGSRYHHEIDSRDILSRLPRDEQTKVVDLVLDLVMKYVFNVTFLRCF